MFVNTGSVDLSLDKRNEVLLIFLLDVLENKKRSKLMIICRTKIENKGMKKSENNKKSIFLYSQS